MTGKKLIERYNEAWVRVYEDDMPLPEWTYCLGHFIPTKEIYTEEKFIQIIERLEKSLPYKEAIEKCGSTGYR